MHYVHRDKSPCNVHQAFTVGIYHMQRYLFSYKNTIIYSIYTVNRVQLALKEMLEKSCSESRLYIMALGNQMWAFFKKFWKKNAIKLSFKLNQSR